MRSQGSEILFLGVMMLLIATCSPAKPLHTEIRSDLGPRAAGRLGQIGPIDDEWRAADLFHDEYRQDLVALQERAERAIQASDAPLVRGWAHLLAARAYRLQGRYEQALEALQHSRLVDDLSLKMRILAEERWVTMDRFTSPWGELDQHLPDVALFGKGADLFSQRQAYSQAHRDTVTRLIGSLQSDPFTMGRESKFAASLLTLVTFAETYRTSLLTHFDDELAGEMRQISEKDIQTTFDAAVQLGLWDSAHAQTTQYRLQTLVQARAENLPAKRECRKLSAGADDALHSLELLSCAEYLLFPGGVAEELGYKLHRPPTTEERSVKLTSSIAWARRVNSPGEADRLQAAKQLQEAAAGFQRVNNQRGLGRVAFVRGASLLAESLRPDRPVGAPRSLQAEREGLTAAVHELERAAQLAQQARDFRLAQSAMALLGIAQELGLERAPALATLQALTGAQSPPLAVGMAYGLARLYAGVATTEVFEKFAPTCATGLIDGAQAFYSAAGFKIESALLLRRRAVILQSSGAMADAELNLAQGQQILLNFITQELPPRKSEEYVAALTQRCQQPEREETAGQVEHAEAMKDALLALSYVSTELALLHQDVSPAKLKEDIDHLEKLSLQFLFWEADCSELTFLSDFAKKLAIGTFDPLILMRDHSQLTETMKQLSQTIIDSMDTTIKRQRQVLDQIKRNDEQAPSAPAAIDEKTTAEEQSARAANAKTQRAHRQRQRLMSRQLALVAASSGYLQLPARRFLYSRSLDEDEIEGDPQLAPAKRYSRSYKDAQAAAGFRRGLMLTNILKRRGLIEQARAEWERANAQSPALPPSLSKLAEKAAPSQSELARLQASSEVSNLKIQAAVFAQLDEPDRAEERLRQVEKLLGTDWYASSQRPWEDLALMVRIQSGLHHPAEALRLAEKMIEQLEDRRETLFDEQFRIGYLDNWQNADVYGSAVLAAARAALESTGADRVDYIAATLSFMERGRARAFQERLASEPDARLNRLKDLGMSVILYKAVLSEKECEGGASADCAPMKQELLRLQAEYEKELNQVIQAKLPQVPPMADRKQRQEIIRQTRQQLGSHRALISYYITDEGLVAVLMTADSLQIGFTLISSYELNGRLNQVSQRATANEKEDGANRTQRQQVTDLLLGMPSFRETLKQTKINEIVLMPHRRLHLFPYSYLLWNQQPIISRFTLRWLPALALLNVKPRQNRAASDFSSAVLRYSEDKEASFSEEATRIANVYHTQPDQNASRATFFRALMDKSVVHLTAHSESPLTGDFAYIKIASDTDPKLSGKITLPDILINIKQPIRCRVLVLASCELSIGRPSFADEYTSIPRAFLQKGAEAVVANLWRLRSNQQTAMILEAFHKNWNRGESDPAVALADAQRDAIRKNFSPEVWAGLVLVGGIP